MFGNLILGPCCWSRPLQKVSRLNRTNGHEMASAKGDRAFALPSLGAAAQYIAPEFNLYGVTLSRPLDATRVSAISLPFQEITPPGLFS